MKTKYFACHKAKPSLRTIGFYTEKMHGEFRIFALGFGFFILAFLPGGYYEAVRP